MPHAFLALMESVVKNAARNYVSLFASAGAHSSCFEEREKSHCERKTSGNDDYQRETPKPDPMLEGR